MTHQRNNVQMNKKYITDKYLYTILHIFVQLNVLICWKVHLNW